MKLLAIDYGEKRTGVAVSDDLGISAHGLDTIVLKGEEELAGRIAEIVKNRAIEKIVIGLPLNMNGTESEKSEKVRAFAAKLENDCGLPVVLWDERMTSMQAQRVMQEMGVKTKGNKEDIDRIAATLMLQEYMKTLP